MTTETNKDFSDTDATTAYAQGFRDRLTAAMKVLNAVKESLDIGDDAKPEERLSKENITEPKPL